MAYKNISLDLDAYEKLRLAKRSGESFSSVVRRATFPPKKNTGAAILERMERIYAEGGGVPQETIEYWECQQQEGRSISPSKWDQPQSM